MSNITIHHTVNRDDGDVFVSELVARVIFTNVENKVD